MSAHTLFELKSANRAAFDHYLRTGERMTSEEWLARQEAKFNPYHDELGRFTFATGATTSRGSAPPQMVAKRKIDEWLGRSPQRPAPAKPKSAPTSATRVAPIQPPVKNLLTQIAKGEGVADDGARRHGFASSYDVTFNCGRFAHQSKPLTQMTLREVDDLQTRILNHPANTHNSTPVGKYQIVRRSLRELKAKLHLRDDMLFDQNLQDRLAMILLEKRGLKNFLDGKISERQFQDNLANEWASIAAPETGRPARARQHLGTTTAQIVPLIRALRPIPPRR